MDKNYRPELIGFQGERRQQAIDEAVRCVCKRPIRRFYMKLYLLQPDRWPILALWVRAEYRRIMEAKK